MFDSNAHKFRRIIAFICLVVAISGVIATQSRGGLLGIAAVLSFFIYQKVKNPVVVGCIGAVGMLAMVAFAGIADRQSGGSHEGGVDESAMGRIYAWQAAINMAIHNPLTGVGVNNFVVNYYFYSPHWDGKNHAVHSTWFQVLGETGIVGICIFVLVIACIYRTLNRVFLMNKQINDKQIDVNRRSGAAPGFRSFCWSFCWNCGRASPRLRRSCCADLVAFDADIDDSVASQGETTSLTFGNPEPDAEKLYFRVSEGE